MSNTSDSHAALPQKDGTRKPGPKGGVLEPYAGNILHMAREGQSMQRIVNWLAQPPRHVAVSRQAVHSWLKARIRKLKKLRTDFMETEIGRPFHSSQVVSAPVTLKQTSGLDPPLNEVELTGASCQLSTNSEVKRIDASRFKVDPNTFDRDQDPNHLRYSPPVSR